MSFNDLERGTYATTDTSGLSADDITHKRAVQTLSRQVFQINASVANIRQLVAQLNTTRDTDRLRSDIHDKTEHTRDLVKRTTAELKVLSSKQQSARGRKMEVQKLTADLRKVVEQFQGVQRVAAEATRVFVDRARHAGSLQRGEVEEPGETSPLLGSDDGRSGGFQQQQQQRRAVELTVLDNDVAYNEALISEREGEIHEIEQGIVELNEIFRDIGSMVTEQQSLFDSIETNMHGVATNVTHAADDLDSANEYHRRSSRTKFCLMLFLVIFIVVALLIMLS
ncbi:hypothetical protein GGI15_004131 [Coemansia interrupta]|uniref:t-SNARE coiled-coil homology domain-containing protein n=1 Tax=Coemansia interrupta TaxID=1126814 RepID=A0A9W8LGT5_9FUNG|nr:hypothetical protein GGI15_004131 [Coemansia interrupta]